MKDNRQAEVAGRSARIVHPLLLT